MPRSLATGHRRVSILLTKPTDMKAPTKAELDAGIFASCRILSEGFTLGPGRSDTVDEGSLCETTTPKVLTNGTWEDGELTVFRYFSSDSPGTPEVGTGTGDDIGDAVFAALRNRGTTLWVVDRMTGKLATDVWEAEDECRVFEVQTDAWNLGEATGYVKAVVPLIVQRGEINAKVAAGAA